MKTLQSRRMAAAVLVCALILGVTGVVEAGMVSPAPLFIDGLAGDDGSCEVANPGTKPVNIAIDVLDATGASVASSGSLTLGAGTSARLSFAAPTDAQYHCTIDTNNTAIRVAINRFSGTSSDLNG